MSCERWNYLVAAVMTAALVCIGFGAEQSEKYQGYLSPMPHNDEAQRLHRPCQRRH